MSWYDHSAAEEQKEALDREIKRRRQRGETFEAFAVPEGSKLIRQFWGKAWSRHLETYCGYDARLGRGRTYLRQGRVYNLMVHEGVAAAEVAGSHLYEVEIHVDPLSDRKWKQIKQECAGQVGSLLDLLSGKLGDDVMKVVADPAKGLFPGRREIRHQCSCPDFADLCKHQAAVLYAIAVLFDSDPAVFFHLRGVDPAELITGGAALGETVLTGAGDLAGEDLGALFGIDLEEDGEVPVTAPNRKSPLPAAKRGAGKPTGKTVKKSGRKKAEP